MVFENGVKNIQAAAYNGTHTVIRNQTIKICISNLEWQMPDNYQSVVTLICIAIVVVFVWLGWL